MTLRDAIKPLDLALCANHFSFAIGSVPVEWMAGDGPENIRATTSGPVLFAARTIYLDPADVPRDGDGRAVLDDVRARETVLHELVHVEQARRGLWYRLKMRWWNLSRAYENRPHEIEARTVAHAWAEIDGR